jgi:hypothetical protein
VVRAHYKPVTGEPQARTLAKELRQLEQEPAGPDRARRLAGFVRTAHEQRLLNLAMHAAQLCVDDDPEAPAALIAAYDQPREDDEELLRQLQDLRDLARYISLPELDAHADARLLEVARAWLVDADQAERRHRLRTLTSILGRARVDDLRDELDGRLR